MKRFIDYAENTQDYEGIQKRLEVKNLSMVYMFSSMFLEKKYFKIFNFFGIFISEDDK